MIHRKIKKPYILYLPRYKDRAQMIYSGISQIILLILKVRIGKKRIICRQSIVFILDKKPTIIKPDKK